MQLQFGPRFHLLHRCTAQIITDALAQMELTASQGRILGFIAHQATPPCPRDIEEHFHLTHPSVSGTLNRMEKKGFLTFRPDAQDHRCKRILLLPKGLACCERLDAVISHIEMQVVADFTREEQQAFSALLNRALKNLGADPGKPFPKEDTK